MQPYLGHNGPKCLSILGDFSPANAKCSNLKWDCWVAQVDNKTAAAATVMQKQKRHLDLQFK